MKLIALVAATLGSGLYVGRTLTEILTGDALRRIFESFARGF